jgi:hypothetical protein
VRLNLGGRQMELDDKFQMDWMNSPLSLGKKPCSSRKNLIKWPL